MSWESLSLQWLVWIAGIPATERRGGAIGVAAGVRAAGEAQTIPQSAVASVAPGGTSVSASRRQLVVSVGETDGKDRGTASPAILVFG